MDECAIASPCIGVCEVDPRSGMCLGCLRTLGEIAAWRDADDDLKTRILARLADRRTAGYPTIDRRGRSSTVKSNPLD